MKKALILLFVLSLFIVVIINKDNILSYLESKLLVPTTLEKNEYTRSYNFNYVKNTDNFRPENKQDLLNLYYTIVNSGMEEFTFYCNRQYLTCENDIKDIIKDQVLISHINNFVHPYNISSGNHLDIYNNYGKITIKNNKLYDDRMKYILDFDVDKIIKENIKDNMSDREKIRIIHDYIINHTKYDQDRADNKNTKYHSDTAFGALEEGYAICSGYADSMMLFLEKFGINNYKIASDNHVWNYVYINNQWYHLDLTWDDPVNNKNEDILEHTYFLITDKQLENLDKTYHTYDKKIYAS